MGEASNPDDLKADIEQTRDDIGRTLEAIGDKLSPRRMVRDAAASVKDAAAEKVGTVMTSAAERAGEFMEQTREAVDTVRGRVSGSRWPAVLIAAGVGWYAYRAFRRSSDEVRDGYSPRWYEEDEFAEDYTDRPDRPSLASRVTRASSRASGELSRIFRQNPLAVGIAAAAIGAAIGLSVPETETENRLMGDTRDAMVNRAREAVADPVAP